MPPRKVVAEQDGSSCKIIHYEERYEMVHMKVINRRIDFYAVGVVYNHGSYFRVGCLLQR